MSDSTSLPLSPILEVLDDLRRGAGVVVIDYADRENEGDFVVPTELVTPEHVAFCMKHARGLVCVSISGEIAEKLNLPLQVLNNNSPFQTPFAVSVDHKDVAAKGITAEARAYTMRKLLDPSSKPGDFVSPGHVFPLIANEAGVMGRKGHTEGSYDLAKLAGFSTSGLLCEILNRDGTLARGEELVRFAGEHGLKITSIEAIRRYRALHEIAVRPLTTTEVETDFGLFRATVFADDVGEREHIALVRGDLSSMPASYAPLVRVHSECLTGDVFGSRRCDCGPQLSHAMKLIVDEGVGIVLYLRQEGRGIGLENKVRAYQLQDTGLDTVEANLKLGFQADQRDFAVGAHMLQALEVNKIRLMTNNPKKGATLEQFGVTVTERVPVLIEPDAFSEAYLRTKKEKLGHLL